MVVTSAGSVREALAAATDALAAAGVGTPRLDAELLLAAALGRARTRLVAEPDAGLDPSSGRRFGAMVRRRVAREPIAYILGSRGFRRIAVACDARALIPRPETELLVELAVELAPRSVLDVGTGSGAIALAVADELSRAEVVATDISPAALELARENARRLGLAGRVRFEEAILPAEGEFDLCLGNLPYVSDGEWERLGPEITRYEPRSALVAGPTGLEAIDAVLGELALADPRPAAVALEVGAGQAPTVAELVSRAGYGRVGVRPDLAGIDRVVIGQ